MASLINGVRDLIRSARHAAASTVNSLQVLTNFETGSRIVEHEQQRTKRAEYRAELLKELLGKVTGEFGRGFSEDNLPLMRKFYTVSSDRSRCGGRSSPAGRTYFGTGATL